MRLKVLRHLHEESDTTAEVPRLPRAAGVPILPAWKNVPHTLQHVRKEPDASQTQATRQEKSLLRKTKQAFLYLTGRA